MGRAKAANTRIETQGPSKLYVSVHRQPTASWGVLQFETVWQSDSAQSTDYKH